MPGQSRHHEFPIDKLLQPFFSGAETVHVHENADSDGQVRACAAWPALLSYP